MVYPALWRRTPTLLPVLGPARMPPPGPVSLSLQYIPEALDQEARDNNTLPADASILLEEDLISKQIRRY